MRGARFTRLLVLILFGCAVAAPLFAQVSPPPTFTDNPLQPGVTPIKMVHVTQLRNAINQLRVSYGLAAVAWADPLQPGVTPVRAAHLAELRAALAGVYAAALRPPPTYSDSPSAGVTLVKAAHIAELRAGLLAIWNLGPPTVSSISPGAGSTSGGTTVTILGANFVNPSVRIGGVPAAIVWVNSDAITATTGARSAGVVDVVVTNRDGQSATLPQGFTYTSPATRYLAFGDSITSGVLVPWAEYLGDGTWYGPIQDAQAPYPVVLSDLLAKPVDNAGNPGEMAVNGAVRLPGTLTADHGTVVILEGTNDANMMTSADDETARQEKVQAIVASLREMVTHVRGQGKNVVLATIPPSIPVQFSQAPYPPDDIYQGPFPWAVALVNQGIVALVAELNDAGVVLADVYAAFGGDTPNASLLCADGLHPSLAGYHVIATTVFDEIRRWGWQ